VSLADSAEATTGTSAFVPDPRLTNEDLAPAGKRNWKVFDLFAMWMSDVHNLGNYTFAAGLLVLGMNVWQVFTSLLVGFVLIYVGMNWMGKIGQRHGVPFPVVSRISFGVWGANIPALIRAVIAIMWYGIQTYLASVAVNVMLLAAWPGLESWTHSSFLGLHALGWVSFLSLWLIQALIISQGMESVRKFQDFCGPAIWLVMIALAVWVLAKAGWSISLTTTPHPVSVGEQWRQWFGAIGLILATYGTLMLNFCDFSRFAPDYRTVRRGNFWGLPVNSTAFVVVSVIVTAGSLEAFGQAITDPAEFALTPAERCSGKGVVGSGLFQLDHYTPKVETVLVPTHDFWGGVGEPTIAVAAPAVLNGIARATGKRVRNLPLMHHELKKAS